MIDLIVFSVGTNKYAVNIANVQRIIQSVKATEIPNAHQYIDGMISYENRVIKILNFRKLIDMRTYHSELTTLFDELKISHVEWVEALKTSLQTGEKFTKTLNPHACGLGKWIDSFTAYDDIVVEILNQLGDLHKQLHLTGAIALEAYERDEEEAKHIFTTKITSIYEQTMSALNKLTNELNLVSNSLQKLIIYDCNTSVFAIRVDRIEDIAHVNESDFMTSSETEESNSNEFLDLDGVLDLNGVLINVIKTVKIPT